MNTETQHMTPGNIKQTVLEVLREIAPEMDPAELKADVSLHDQLDIDSMDYLTFVTKLHQRTGVDIPEIDYPRLSTLHGAVAYLSDKLGSGP